MPSHIASSFFVVLESVAWVACAPPEPTRGAYAEISEASNTCNYDVNEANGSGGFVLEALGRDKYRVTPNDGAAPFECPLEGDEIACPEPADEATKVGGFDAELHVQVSERRRHRRLARGDHGFAARDGHLRRIGLRGGRRHGEGELSCTSEVDFGARLEEAR